MIKRLNTDTINFRFFCLENNTRGAAETFNIGINNFNEERDIPVLYQLSNHKLIIVCFINSLS